MGSILSLRSRRSIGELKFPRSLFRQDLRYLLLFDGQTGLTKRVNNRALNGGYANPSIDPNTTWGIGAQGHHLRYTVEELLTTIEMAGWSQGTCAFICRPRVDANCYLVDDFDDVLTDECFEILGSAGAWTFIKTSSVSTITLTASAGTFAKDLWYLVVADFGPAGMNLWVDGVLIASNATTTGIQSQASPTDLRLGSRGVSTVAYGPADWMMFSLWKRQIGPIVNHGLRHLVRAA